MRSNQVFTALGNARIRVKRMLLLAICCSALALPGFSQEKISLDLSGSIKNVLKEIEKKTEYSFVYADNSVDVQKTVTVKVTNESIDNILSKVFEGTNIQYTLKGKQVALYPKGSKPEDATGAATTATVAGAAAATSTLSGSTGGAPQAQTSTSTSMVSGRIMDEAGLPLPGVSIMVKGTKSMQITSSGSDGNFKLTNVKPDDKTIVLSFIGMQLQEIDIPASRNVGTVVMKDDVTELTGAMVTGYQTISKERATGSYGILDSKLIDKTISINAASAIEGKLSGVVVQSDGGILIRGRSTISENVGTNPLLVIDGMPTERALADVNMNDVENFTVLKDAAAASIYGVRAANGVIVITTKKGEKGKTNVTLTGDWQLIENPSLSDYRYASTSDIIDWEMSYWDRAVKNYGSTELAYFNNQVKGIGNLPNYISPLGDLRWQKAKGAVSQENFDAALATMRTLDYRQEYMDNAWRNPFRQSYNLSISNASDRQNTYLSFNFTDNRLQNISSDNQNYKTYFKSSQKITKWLTVNAGVDVQYSKSKSPALSQLTGIARMEAYTPILDYGNLEILRTVGMLDLQDGKAYRKSSDILGSITNSLLRSELNAVNALHPGTFESYSINTLDELNTNYSKNSALNVRTFVDAEIKLLKGLSYKPSFSYETTNTTADRQFDSDSYYLRYHRNRMVSKTTSATTPPIDTYTKNLIAGDYLSRNYGKSANYVFRNQLEYSGTIGKNHNISAIAGMELRENSLEANRMVNYLGYDDQVLSYQKDPNLLALLTSGISSYVANNSQTIVDIYQSPAVSEVLHRYVGMYGTAGYSYKNLYNASASFRIDQADLFGTDPKYRYRPLWSVGLGWNMSNEAFMKDIKWLNKLSLKGSYGVTGNVDQTSTPYIVASLSSNGRYFPNPIIATMLTDYNVPNPLLRWEMTTSYGGEIDYALFDHLLSGKIEAYYKYSEDLLVDASTPSYATGYAKGTANNGAMSNKGIEFTINSPWFTTENWKLSSTLIMSFNKNTIEKVKITPNTAGDLLSNIKNYFLEGNPRNSLYAFTYGGLTTGGTDEQNGAPIIYRADGTPYYGFNADGTLFIPTTTMLPGDLTYMGSLDPLWNGAFTQLVGYKSWELSFMVTYSGGNKMRMPSYTWVSGTPDGNLSADIINAWSPTNIESTIPKSYINYSTAAATGALSITNAWANSDANVVGGDIIRLRNIALSYRLPAKFAKKVFMQNLKLTAQVNNLWFWSAAGDGVDPETQARNSTVRTPATPVSYLLRLEIGF